MSNKFFEKTDFTIIPVGTVQRNASIGSNVTITIPDDAEGILLQAIGDTVNFTIDGSAASSTTGFQLSTNEGVTRLDLYPGADINIESTSSGEARYQFFRRGGVV